ncbi:Uncharacterized protein GBIM_04393 [Gryllus bimaculatus]|nr:Uncharacterized protein GBIM_04393 [Gryllus bimaculatus]
MNTNRKSDVHVGEHPAGEKTVQVPLQPACSAGTTSGTEIQASLVRRLDINVHSNFMRDFDPQSSQRVARKQERKQKKRGPSQQRLYDHKGRLLGTGEDLCDCLIDDCPGCHFPCPKCRSCKCGHECRRNRKWRYDEIEIEGTDVVIKRKS